METMALKERTFSIRTAVTFSSSNQRMVSRSMWIRTNHPVP